MKTSDKKSTGHRGAYKPSAEEIERACAKIQQNWSVRQRDKRAGRTSQSQWSPPRVDWSSITDALSESQSDSTGVSSWAEGAR